MTDTGGEVERTEILPMKSDTVDENSSGQSLDGRLGGQQSE